MRLTLTALTLLLFTPPILAHPIPILSPTHDALAHSSTHPPPPPRLPINYAHSSTPSPSKPNPESAFPPSIARPRPCGNAKGSSTWTPPPLAEFAHVDSTPHGDVVVALEFQSPEREQDLEPDFEKGRWVVRYRFTYQRPTRGELWDGEVWAWVLLLLVVGMVVAAGLEVMALCKRGGGRRGVVKGIWRGGDEEAAWGRDEKEKPRNGEYGEWGEEDGEDVDENGMERSPW